MRVRREASPSTSAGDQARVSVSQRGQGGARRAAAGDARGHRHGVAHEARQAVGQDGDGGRQRRLRQDGRRASASTQTASDQRRDVHRGHRLPVAERQRSGGRPVEGLAREERSEGRPDRRARPCSPARSGRPSRPRPSRHTRSTSSPPRSAGSKRSGPAATSGADEEGRARDEGDRAARPHRPLPRAPVERRPQRLVAARRAGARPRGAGTIRGATAATSGSSKWPSSGASQPAAGTQSESTKATSVLSTAANPALRAADGADVDRQPDEPGAVALGDLLGGAGVGRRVVDHDARQVAERAEQPVELCRPVAHRHDDRHVLGPEGGRSAAAARRRRRHQAARQELRRPAGADRRAARASAPRGPGPAPRSGRGAAGCLRAARSRRRSSASRGPRSG